MPDMNNYKGFKQNKSICLIYVKSVDVKYLNLLPYLWGI